MKKSKIILLCIIFIIAALTLTFCEAHWAFVYDKPVDAAVLADLDAMSGTEAEMIFMRGGTTYGYNGEVESGAQVMRKIGFAVMNGKLVGSDVRLKSVTIHAPLWWNPWSIKSESEWSPVFYGIIPALYYLIY